MDKNIVDKLPIGTKVQLGGNFINPEILNKEIYIAGFKKQESYPILVWIHNWGNGNYSAEDHLGGLTQRRLLLTRIYNLWNKGLVTSKLLANFTWTDYKSIQSFQFSPKHIEEFKALRSITKLLQEDANYL